MRRQGRKRKIEVVEAGEGGGVVPLFEQVVSR